MFVSADNLISWRKSVHRYLEAGVTRRKKSFDLCPFMLMEGTLDTAGENIIGAKSFPRKNLSSLFFSNHVFNL